MEGISQREDVLLGYNPITQGRESDVDFSDVFGGPPRRCSTQSGDSNNEREEEEEEGSSSSSSPWMRLREKPVFGEAVTTGVGVGVRRRYTSDDFFDDIFRGDQPSGSCSQSPRVSYMSAPGSRVMSPSPSRSLPPAPASAFATPSKFSLPSHVVTNTEFAASTSMNNQSPPLSRFNQTMQNHDSTESTSSRPTTTHLEGNVKGSDFPIYATHFHFSIYKWGTKSVPLVVSLRKNNPISNKPTKLQPPCPSDTTTENVYISDALFSAKTVRRPSSSPPVKQGEQHRNHSFESPLTTDPKPKEDVIVTPSSVANLTTKDTGFVVHTSNDPPKPLSQTTSKLRPLSSLLNDVNAGSEEIGTRNIGDEMNRVVEKEKASSIADVLNRRINRNKVQKSSPTTKKEGGNSKASGTVVKDFVKIFNKESPSKVSSHGVHRSDSKKWKDTKPIEIDQEVRFSTVRMEDENEAAYVNWEEACPDTVEMEDGFPSETQQFHVDDIGCEPQIAEPSSSSSVNAPNVDSVRDSAPNNNNAACDDEVMSKEVTKGYESKVLQWSKGKEGNIRALLSTLQYVLWAESGWKPVPLVDIIEANAVKRAYQKALLRLHPDKLQQKGTAPHHKFIAEKVFDILQEAWDQFNSLGSL